MENDVVLNKLDERAQQLRQSEFLGPDYVPNANAVFEEDQLHAEIVYLDDVTNPEVTVENITDTYQVEDAIDDLADVVEEGLDSLTSTITQQKEDAAVEAASTIKNYPVAVFGQPDFGDRVIDVDVDNDELLDGQEKQTNQLVAVRDLLEDVYVEQREQRRFDNAEDAEFSEIEEDTYRNEQIMLLENMNETLKDIERNGGAGGGAGGGLFDSLLDMVGLGDGKDKKGGGRDNDINRRNKKGGFFKGGGKGGKILQGALAAGAALYVFDDFLWGDETDPTDKGFVGALGSAMFGDETTPEQQQVINETKNNYKEQLQTTHTQTQIIQDQDENGDSSPITQGAMALGGTLAIGAGYKKFIGEANPMMGTKGGLNAALHAPALPSPVSNPVTSTLAKGTALAGDAAASSKGIMSKIPYLNLLLGGLDVYSTVTNDELTTSEKVADVAGVGGGYAGAAAGAAAMGSLGAAVGTVVPGLGNLIGGGLGGLIGGGLGYWGGEELVSSAMDWMLGNDRDKPKDEPMTAEEVAQKAQPEWWEDEPTETSDGQVIAGGKTFRDMSTYRKMQDQKIRTETTKANASGVSTAPTTVTKINGEVVTDTTEAQIESTQFSAEATTKNSDALDKLTKAIDDAGLGLTGLGVIAGSAKTAWDWAKSMFGFGDDEKEVTAEQVALSPVPIEAQVSQQYGDAAVDTLDATTSKPKLKSWGTSAAMYDSAQTSKEFEKTSFTNATLKEAVTAIETYSETKRGYENWLDDFGKTDITYDQFLSYFNGGTAVPQFVGGQHVSSKETVAKESTSNETVSTEKSVDNTVESEEKIVDPMNGVAPKQNSPKQDREINWTPTESPWHNWSETYSDYSKFSNQGDSVQVNNVQSNQNVPYRIDQNPNADVEVAPASTDIKHTNFVDTRQIIMDTATNTNSAAYVEASEKKEKEKTKRETTRDGIKVRSANRASGKTQRPNISDVPIIIDDSGLTALNLGYL